MKTASSSNSILLNPLQEFYSQAGRILPRMDLIQPGEVPQPYHGLLVHEQDMTSTLERFHGQRIHLRLLRRQRHEELYFREVALLLEDGKPVEFGAIRIDLSLFPAPARDLILEAEQPLGRILATCQVPFRSQPQSFLKVWSDTFIESVLGMNEGGWLFGRRNSLRNPEGESLAEIIEILPPAAPASTAPSP